MPALAKAAWVAVVPTAFLMALTPGAAAIGNVDCRKVRQYFVPCAGYLFSRSAANPSVACCTSLRRLNAQSKGPVRQGVCECLKSNAASLSGLYQNHATSLSSKCGISLKTAVSFNTDCRKA
ncbi:hypothetical protein KP509_13G067200 [Ceratopteris richardii]|uniref:Non-specific lipid-transfer protein n=1 Tax=Ceratopteris richardii TaxID=49495 RepID=A0A8T2TIP2_CERRI|nr:hypothetical protein KP509_13G067000 [Ceratopteris richardii]KAH7421616.1 hypothetical protein KP509_13G067200 [Ceratopteris richardii]